MLAGLGGSGGSPRALGREPELRVPWAPSPERLRGGGWSRGAECVQARSGRFCPWTFFLAPGGAYLFLLLDGAGDPEPTPEARISRADGRASFPGESSWQLSQLPAGSTSGSQPRARLGLGPRQLSTGPRDGAAGQGPGRGLTARLGREREVDWGPRQAGHEGAATDARRAGSGARHRPPRDRGTPGLRTRGAEGLRLGVGPSPLLPGPPGIASSATFQAAADPGVSSSARRQGWALAFSLPGGSCRPPASQAPP
ncbi:putative uncharacterized protein LINC02875 [Chlorocebus sabaeus]|uniref:putative uncharacterized protein LINC02875 n=1 Tax=Chlorocebus sabaeus TaxID=60711 RepID=UPI003BFA133E